MYENKAGTLSDVEKAAAKRRKEVYERRDNARRLYEYRNEAPSGSEHEPVKQATDYTTSENSELTPVAPPRQQSVPRNAALRSSSSSSSVSNQPRSRRESIDQISTGAKRVSEDPFADFDLQERAALRREEPAVSRQVPPLHATTRSPESAFKRPNFAQEQVQSFEKDVGRGKFKFGLDRAKETAKGPPLPSMPRTFGERHAAPWGQHLKVRQPEEEEQRPARVFDRTDQPPLPASRLASSKDRVVMFNSRARDAPVRPPKPDAPEVVEPDVVKVNNDQTTSLTERAESDRPRRKSSRLEVEQEEDEDTKTASSRRRDKKKPARSRKVSNDEDDMDFMDEDYVPKRERKKQKKAQKAADEGPRLTPIELPPFISVQNLATALRVRPEDFVKRLEELGFEQIAMDHVMNAESAGLVAMEYGYEPTIDHSETEDLLPRPPPEDTTALPQRPPVVTIMGHVDHGKTTLLDYLRQSSVAASEHGGITQHIGAFSIPIASANNRMVTFLDTPGHAAFLNMRQRGANVTDIVVLVVAADDSVKPQTIEAIRHAKAAGVQIIVAISKVDKDDADVYRVKQDLIQHDIEVEDFGGSIQAVEVSGKTGQGVGDLEEAIVTLADVLEVRADADGPAEGWVLEAATNRAGRSATVLVRRGTLRPGDVLVAGTTWTRVRNLRNEAGTSIAEATPGTPVEVDGWRDQPAAGDEVLGAPSEAKATAVVAFREERAERLRASVDMEAINESRRADADRRIREKEAAALAEEQARAEKNASRKDINVASRAAKEEVHDAARKAASNNIPTLYLVIKADVSGSTEAVTAMINTLPLGNQPVAISVLREGVGHVSESDVAHAAAVPAGHGYIVNFNQVVPSAMSSLAEKNGVKLIDQTIIYNVVDEVKEVVEQWLPPIVTARVVGEAEAAQVFEIKGNRRKTTKVAGCRITNGTFARNNLVRVYRGGIGAEGTLIFDGRHTSTMAQWNMTDS